MDSFAFIIHPIDPKRDVSRKYPLLGRVLSERQINFFSRFFPPVYISEINGIVSTGTGKEIKGWFIACPLTPQRMLELPEKIVYRKIVQAGRMAEKLGARMLGLGAFTSVIGDGGLTIAHELEIPVTTGDAYTIAIAIQAVRWAAAAMDIQIPQATVAIVGAHGAIGRVCAELLAPEAAELILIGRNPASLEALKQDLQAPGARAVLRTATDLNLLGRAQLVISVTSALDAIIQPEHLRPGTVVCDVAGPRDVSRQVAQARQDVLVIDGGMVDVPGPVNFHFDFGFPPGKAYACMAETIALTLEGRFSDYTLGKHIERARVDEINQLATRHGFRSSGFRSFERAVGTEHIARVRRQAGLPAQTALPLPAR